MTSVHPGSILRVKGNYFGVKKPKFTLEAVAGNTKPLKVKVLPIYTYADSKGRAGKSCMNIQPSAQGESEVYVELPQNCQAGNYEIVLNNKVGVALTPITVLGRGANAGPVANDDTFELEYGASSYNLDVLVNDTDNESDAPSVTLFNSSLPSGAKVRYNSKLMNITYTLPKTVDASSTFTDTFTYNLSDGTGQSSATVTVTVNPITVTSVTTWSGTSLGTVFPTSRIVLNGSHFGIQAPTIGLTKGNGVVIKAKVVSQPQYTDYSGRENASYTDLNSLSSSFGDSSLIVEIPSKCNPGIYNLILNNGADTDSSVTVTVGSGANSVPVGQNDDIILYSGDDAPYFLIDVLADNGSGVDTDKESDTVVIVPISKTSYKGGRVSFDKKSGKIKYIRPKAASSTLAEFADHFQYRLDDVYNKGAGTVYNVNITVKRSR
jgi:hypothetical protein